MGQDPAGARHDKKSVSAGVPDPSEVQIDNTISWLADEWLLTTVIERLRLDSYQTAVAEGDIEKAQMFIEEFEFACHQPPIRDYQDTHITLARGIARSAITFCNISASADQFDGYRESSVRKWIADCDQLMTSPDLSANLVKTSDLRVAFNQMKDEWRFSTGSANSRSACQEFVQHAMVILYDHVEATIPDSQRMEYINRSRKNAILLESGLPDTDRLRLLDRAEERLAGIAGIAGNAGEHNWYDTLVSAFQSFKRGLNGDPIW